jgi:hypothetical protein
MHKITSMEKKTEYEYYEEVFKQSQESYVREGNKFDRIIILISLGAIVLSVQ